MNDVSRPDELATRIKGVGRWNLEVVESRMITPRMHRIGLKGSAFDGFDYLPGQDVMVWVPGEEGRMLYRRYTIRHFKREAATFALDIYVHGNGGPGEKWAKSLRIGDQVETVGPRGKITLVPAPWHLFVGDETYISATFAMLDALPAGTPALIFLEVAGPEEEQSFATPPDVQLRWIHRGKAAPGDATGLVTAIESATLPTGVGHAYVGAELQVARAVSRALEARGLSSEQISSKAYWGRGRANASIGEPGR